LNAKLKHEIVQANAQSKQVEALAKEKQSQVRGLQLIMTDYHSNFDAVKIDRSPLS